MIRIVIAEDQEILCETISSLLNLEDDMKVVGHATNGEEAINLVHGLKPDVCLMDIDMQFTSGLEAAEILKSLDSKVIILTTFARKGYWQRALKADVRGYLLKDSPSEDLVYSIRRIISGKRIYSQELMDEECNRTEIAEEPIIIEATDSKPMLGTVRGYLSTIREKMKLLTG